VLTDVTTIDNNLAGLLQAVGEALGAAPATPGPTMREAVARARGESIDEVDDIEPEEFDEDEEELAAVPAAVPAAVAVAAAPAPRSRRPARRPAPRPSAGARSSAADDAGMRAAVARARERLGAS
jgi:hypothetical protein